MERVPNENREDLNIYIDGPHFLGPFPSQYSYPHMQAQKLLGEPYCPETVGKVIVLIELAIYLGECQLDATGMAERDSRSQSG